MEEQVLEVAKESGLLTFDNGVKILAGIGAAAVGFYGIKAIKKAYAKKKANKVYRHDGETESSETIDVEAEIISEAEPAA